MVELGQVTFVGENLNRPESVIATARGEIFVSDDCFGVVALGHPAVEISGKPSGFLPNGIAMLPDRQFLIANLSPEGGVWRLDRAGRLHPHILAVEGISMAFTNFVSLDVDGGLWISVCTRSHPREKAFRSDVHDGFLIRHDRSGTRIVADGLSFANECRLDPLGRYLYVNETFARRISRFPNNGGTLGPRESVYEFGPGEFPDGLAFDSDGGIWIACIVANRLIRLDPEGQRETILDDSDPKQIAQAEVRYLSHAIDRADVDAGATRSLRNISSVAFGGPDLRTIYLGCLGGKRIPTIRSRWAGAELPHWRY